MEIMGYKQPPFPMINGTEGHNKYKERQLKKAAKLSKRADDIEEAEKRGEFQSIFYSADRARKRSKTAKAKATTGSRKAWKRAKRNFSSVRPLYFDMD
jgi:hypothetical protein